MGSGAWEFCMGDRWRRQMGKTPGDTQEPGPLPPYPFPPASLPAASPTASLGGTQGRSCWASAWIAGSHPSRRWEGETAQAQAAGCQGLAQCLLTRFRPSEMLMMASISSSFCEAQRLCPGETHPRDRGWGDLRAPEPERGWSRAGCLWPCFLSGLCTWDLLTYRGCRGASRNRPPAGVETQCQVPGRGFIPFSLPLYSTGLPKPLHSPQAQRARSVVSCTPQDSVGLHGEGC